MTDEKNKNIATSSAELNTDEVAQGTNHLYLTLDGGLSDNLPLCENFNLVSSTLNAHLVNTANPHSEILLGLRTHQTEYKFQGGYIFLDQANYIDSLLVQANNDVADLTIVIPDEDSLGYTFATHASFSAFRMGTANLTVKAALNVSFTNYTGILVVLPDPQTSYYTFIRQSKNCWAVVTYASAGSSQVVVSWDGSVVPVAVTAGPGISITGGVITASAASSVKTTTVTTTSTMTADAAINIFVMQNTSPVILTLPSSFTAGQIFKIIGGANTASYSIALNAGQFVNVISNGVAVSATSSLHIDTLTDSMELVANSSTQLTLTSSNSPDINFM